jgi:hypothetical protein
MNNTTTTTCFPSVAESWDCDGQGNCFDPGTGNGQYSSFSICNNICVNTSIEEITNELFLYPNPTNTGIFTIGLGFSSDYRVNVEVFNTLGQQIFNKQITDFSAESQIEIIF